MEEEKLIFGTVTLAGQDLGRQDREACGRRARRTLEMDHLPRLGACSSVRLPSLPTPRELLELIFPVLFPNTVPLPLLLVSPRRPRTEPFESGRWRRVGRLSLSEVTPPVSTSSSGEERVSSTLPVVIGVSEFGMLLRFAFLHPASRNPGSRADLRSPSVFDHRESSSVYCRITLIGSPPWLSVPITSFELDLLTTRDERPRTTRKVRSDSSSFSPSSRLFASCHLTSLLLISSILALASHS